MGRARKPLGKEMLEIKNRVTEKKDAFDELFSRLNTAVQKIYISVS